MTDQIDDRLRQSIRNFAEREEAERQAKALAERQQMDEQARQAERTRMASEMWDTCVAVLPEIAGKIISESGNNFKMTFQGRPNPAPFLRSITLNFQRTNTLLTMMVVLNLNSNLQLECNSDAFDSFSRDMMRIEKIAFTGMILDLFDRFINPRSA